MIREYRDIKQGEMSVRTILAEREVTGDNGRKSVWVLKHHSAGWECAGSCARDTAEKWSVTSFDRGANHTHGNSFLNEASARRVFDSDKPWYVPNR